MASEDSMINVMLGAIFTVAGIMALAPTLQRIFSVMPSAQQLRYLQAQAYEGLTDSRELNATPTMQWLNLISGPPYVGWITASFVNDGPNSVFIGINNPGEMHEIAAGQGYNVSMVGAERRIELVFYRANLGERASVSVVGKY